MNTSELAQVLFTTALQESGRPTPEQVREAVGDRLMSTDPGSCAAAVAQEAGDHPEVYRARMRWALEAVGRAYASRTPVAA